MYSQPYEPWVPPDLAQLVGEGEVRRITRGGEPRTVQQILADASKAMDDEDEAQLLADDPVMWLRRRRSRRNLLGRILYGKG